MPQDNVIRGNPGTDPVGPSIAPAKAPPQSEQTGRLVDAPGGLFVQVGMSRIRLDAASVAKLRGSPPAGSPPRPGQTEAGPLQAALDAVVAYGDMLKAKPGVLGVRAGYKFIGGRITEIPCVVVAVDRKRGVRGADAIPAVLPNGVPTDVTPADPYDRLAARSGHETVPLTPKPRLLIEEIQSDTSEAGSLEALPMTTYERPKGLSLEPVTGAMTITCHVSPDAGWRVLEPFLKATRRDLCLGMYDFTAPHIYKAVRSLLRDSSVSWKQTLGPGESLPSEEDVDSSKADDKSEQVIVAGLKRLARNRFDSAFAHTGAGRTFASAYHIKVAVRDDSAFWLSSGNWQSSNQPNIDLLASDADRQLIPTYNREWHVVVENVALAKIFKAYLEYDFEVASTAEEAAQSEASALMPDLMVPFEETMMEERAAVDLEVFAPRTFTFTATDPLTVQPVLTPDNYLEVVLDFLKKRPVRTLYFQNQSLNPIKDPSPEFKEMMRLLAKYSKEQDLDARFIFRNIGPTRKKVESLQLAGFDMKRVRMQSGCHTKGIIVDSETILLGSHNVTNQGVQVNRDASLLLRHKGIARYYERVFLHDWDHLARDTVREEATPLPLLGRHEAAGLPDAGLVRRSWSEYAEE